MTPSEMIEEMNELGYTLGYNREETYTVERWVRPDEYPDPTVIDISNFDGVYLTYDLRKTIGYGFIGIYVLNDVNRTNYYVERGHIENNEFVVDYSETMLTGGYFRQSLDETNGLVQLWRVWSENRITRFCFVPNSTTTANNFHNCTQPCVEKYGRLPYVKNLGASIGSGATSCCYSTQWMEREDVKDVVNVNNMSATFFQCKSLKEIRFDGWDTSKVTTFSDCFENCWSLSRIPLENINTDSATSMYDMFANCRALDYVNISHFNIDKVTTMAYMFSGCYMLEHLEMSSLRGTGKLNTTHQMFANCRRLKDIDRNVKNLNMSNVTTIQNMFLCCYCVEKLDLSEWNASSVTNAISFCDQCYSLRIVDVSGIDATNITTMNSMFKSNYQLKRLDISEWKMESIITMTNMFSECWSLEEIKMPKVWNLSTLTNPSYMFQNCKSLREITIENWNQPNVITTMAYMFSGCTSLKKVSIPNLNFTVPVVIECFLQYCNSLVDLDIFGWTFKKISTIFAFFNECHSLEEIDISSWSLEDPNINDKASVNNLFGYLSNCKSIKMPLSIKVTNGSMTNFINADSQVTYIDIRNMDLSQATNVTSANIPTLIEYYPPLLPPFDSNYSDAVRLSHDSIIRILNNLPTVSTSKRITLSQYNKLKLTPEEIAIATDKGWTVS